ncbi:hypothetical protein RhiirA4_539719 [Rhizophagus irregularis]|uniref:Uncharacterized protein n=1 Tax=Rhizophagus irregularis TaxID=588596 RepID=A0A2I1G4P4_9GLOM|nr:hypothetical protein RhiirA4_539719 [Rhizophagus irregularis]
MAIKMKRLHNFQLQLLLIFYNTLNLHMKFMINLSREYQFNLPTPYSIFSLFFSLEQIKTIIKNTNTYACIKNGGGGRK